MPVFLGEYSGTYGRSAVDREVKLLRAVRSVIDQTLQSWELVIVADGCEATWALREHILAMDPRIRVLKVAKQRLWSGVPRSVGIMKGTGQYIRYIDSDDMLGPEDLQTLHDGLWDASLPDIGLCCDRVWNGSAWQERLASDTRSNGIGCSNIVHVRDQRTYWPDIVYRHPANGYDHDRQYFRHLKNYFEPVHITGGAYFVMHVPRLYDL
jgi:glycosyltransferase involved in cell wall biosynthesis